MGKKVKRLYYQAQAKKAADKQAAAEFANIQANRAVDLNVNNSPEVSTAEGGAENTASIGGETVIKKRRATGSLASQLGVNV